jgi:HSP20 family protein
MFEEIDNTIQSVERLYRTVAGHDAQNAESPYAPIPPEKDAAKHVEDQLDRLLSSLVRVPVAATAGAAPAWAPPVTVWERTEEIIICVDLPGVPRDAVAVSATANMLVVSGRRPIPMNGGGEVRLSSSETPFGAFRRYVALPQGAQADRLTAHMKEGVLELHVPRSPIAQAPRTITVS